MILYIDPGTGSLLISAIIGLGMTILFTAKGFFYKTIAKLSGKSYKGRNDFSGKLVFFNEGRNYWNVFKPIVEKLIKQKQEFVYLSADKNDPGLNINSQYCEPIFIGKMQQAVFFLNRIKAKMCVTTTPQLDVIAFKRSKEVKHYCYLNHSFVDIHAYKKFAFSYYDSILCGSKYHIKNLRQLEQYRKDKKKILMETGCTYFDEYKINSITTESHVLLAPTWGDRSFLNQNCKELINYLLEGKSKIVFRPHPQSWISDKKVLQQITDIFGSNEKFEIDKSTDNSKSLEKAHTLICDISSGIIFDAAFIYKKSIIAIDFKWDDGGYESSDLENKASTNYLLEDIGKVIYPNDYKNINSIIKEIKRKEITEDVINKHIFNFRKAGKVSTEQIISIFNKID